MAKSSDNIRGAIFMMLSMAGFVISDAIMKLVVADLSLFQAIFLRGSFAAMLMVFLAWHVGALAYRPARGDCVLLGFRTIGEIGGMVCLLNALINIPIINATAIVQAMPLVVTLGASFVFGERVGLRSYLAIIIGLFGVLMIIRPGSSGFTAHSLWAIGTVFFFAFRDLSTRRLSPEVPSTFAAMITSIAITLAGAMISLASPWQPVSVLDLRLLMIAAACTVAGYLFGVMTMRIGDIGFVAPFRYSILLWALLLGILMFGEIPDRITMLGSAVVVGMGIYAISQGRRAPSKPVLETSRHSAKQV